MASKVSNVKVRLQPNVDNTLLATWNWSNKHTDHYEYKWHYSVIHKYNNKTKKWEDVWIEGSTGSSNTKSSTYSIPPEAVQVRFSVKPISKTYKKKNKDEPYWNGSWSSWVYYKTTNLSPDIPSPPNVELTPNKTQIFAYVDVDISRSSINRAVRINFQLYNVTDDKYVKVTPQEVNKTTGRAATYFNLTVGKSYRVRCQAVDSNGNKSGWSTASPYRPESIKALPAAVKNFTTCKLSALSSSGEDKRVELAWKKPSGPIKGYEIQYTTKKEYFDVTDYVQSVRIEDSSIVARIIDIQNSPDLFGNLWFFRIKSFNDTGDSTWSAISSLSIGTEPEAPTTWSLSQTVEVGTDAVIYWTHNTVDGSKEVSAKVHTLTTIPGGDEPVEHEEEILKVDDESISQYTINTDAYPNGATIEYKVKTKGIYSGNGTTDGYGDYSISRTINVVAQPTIEVIISQENDWYWDSLNFDTGDIHTTEGELGEDTDQLTNYPFFVHAIAGPNSQKVLRWYVDIIFDDDIEESYESILEGAKVVVNKGDIVYSKHFDGDDDNQLFLALNSTDVALENNMTYTVRIRAVMDSGLSVEEEKLITIAFEEDDVDIWASITIDEDNATAYIKPWATNKLVYGTVVLDSFDDLLKFQPVDEIDLIPFESTEGLSEGDEVTVHIKNQIAIVFDPETDEDTPIDDVYFSIHRINFDGTFTEVQSGIDSAQEATIIDMHPALDYARYRIVATSKTTGKSFYEDYSELTDIGDIIIQWMNEPLNDFVINENGEIEDYQEFSGEFLRLPWNIDTSEEHTRDNAFVEYIGREHPVAYYGTQLGETAVWNTDVDKDDTETIYALRRLAIYQGDVYAREPSGVGYWASVSVSFNKTHNELTIPVTLSVTRVEGGA